MKPTKNIESALAALEGVDGQEKPSRPAQSTRPQYRVMDEIARKRRLKHELDSLERDNYHEDPHANLTLSKKIPKFDDGPKGDEKITERRRSNLRLRALNFAQLVEEDMKRPPPNYSGAVAPGPDKFNLHKRHFCSVCGFTGKYTCVTCGSRFCSTNCLGTHRETRCMKWIA